MAKAAAAAPTAGPTGVRLATRMRRVDGSAAEVEGTATAVTYRGRPAVQLLMREVDEDRPASSADVYGDALPASHQRAARPRRPLRDISQAYRHRARVGVVHVDLDGFTALNARVGRAVADRVLRGVGRRLAHCVRQGDTAARLEADAFALVLPGLHHGEDATRIAEKVLRALRKPFPLADGTIPLTASVGVGDLPGGRRGRPGPPRLGRAVGPRRPREGRRPPRVERSARPRRRLRRARARGGPPRRSRRRDHGAQRQPHARRRPALPADLRPRPAARGRGGGAPALAAPADGSRLPAELPLEVRLHRPHPRHRPLDPPDRGRPGPGVAAAAAHVASRGQPLPARAHEEDACPTR